MMHVAKNSVFCGAARWWRALPVFLVAMLPLSAASAAPGPKDSAELKIYLAEPGVYAVPFEDLAAALGPGMLDSLASVGLSHRGQPVRRWIESAPDGSHGPGSRLFFVVPQRLTEYQSRHDYSALAIFLLDIEGAPASPPPAAPPATVEPTGATAPLRPTRRIRFEQDRVRAPLSSRDVDIASMWFWSSLSPLASSELRLELGPLVDLDVEGEVRLRVRVLGWSRDRGSGDLPQHQIDVFLDEEKIGSGQWDGRRIHEFELSVKPSQLQGAAALTLKVPSRTPEGATKELVDVSYIDWVEIEYAVRADSLWLQPPAMLPASQTARWLPEAWSPQASSPGTSSELATGDGQRLQHVAGRGWWLPASNWPVEIWPTKAESVKSPIAIEAVTTGAGLTPEGTEYLVIAGPGLLTESRRLAALHRRRGLETHVVDVRAIDDAFDEGYRSAAAIRSFLVWQHKRGDGALRYVVLAGDADWLAPGDTRPPGDVGELTEPTRRNLIPTWTRLSDYGPAASDHPADAKNVTSPLFALGRLPVVSERELRIAVNKIERHLEIATACAKTDSVVEANKPTILLTSDSSVASGSRRWRLLQKLDGLEAHVVTVEDAEGRAADEALIDALDNAPDLVHFDGHGGRHMWQLGEPYEFSPKVFFDLGDLEHLEPQKRLPVMVAVSCATAPFDHPSATSLGEDLVLAEERGAVAYIGASVRLINQPRVSPLFVQALVEEETVGEAMVRAKREIGLASISYLYNLIGDPALPLFDASSCVGETQ